MKHIVIIGRKFSSLTNYLDENNFKWTLLQDIRFKKNDEINEHVLNVDFSDERAIDDALNKIQKPIDGLTATYENYILPMAKIAKKLGLPGMPIESAKACTDKFFMRQLFSKAPIKISPDFELINNKEDLIDFANNHSFPLIIKPTNLAKSLLVTKSNNLEELLYNYEKSVKQIGDIYQKYAPNRKPQLLVEEYLSGTIHSVDAFVGNDGQPQVLEQVVDYQTGYDIGFDDNFHYSRILPSKLLPEQQLELRKCAAIGIEALGMKNSPAHVEIIMSSDGPRIVEIGARNGGYRERMHKMANGIDIIGAAICIAMGERPNTSATRNDPIAVLELFPKSPGIFTGLENLDKLEKLPSLKYLSVKVRVGDYIGKSSDGYKAAAIIILNSSDQQEFNKDLEFVNAQVFVKVN